MAIDKQLLGKAIRQVRQVRGISQAALAKEAGMQGNSVALIERGQRGVSMDALNALADVLEVPAACLAMLGTAKIAGQSDSVSLVKSLQKLILATVVAQEKTQAEEAAESVGRKIAGKGKTVRRKVAKKKKSVLPKID